MAEYFPVNRKVFNWPPEPIRFVGEMAILGTFVPRTNGSSAKASGQQKS